MLWRKLEKLLTKEKPPCNLEKIKTLVISRLDQSDYFNKKNRFF